MYFISNFAFNFFQFICLCVYVVTECEDVWKSADSIQKLLLSLSLWVLEFKLRWSGLFGKCFCPLSYPPSLCLLLYKTLKIPTWMGEVSHMPYISSSQTVSHGVVYQIFISWLKTVAELWLYSSNEIIFWLASPRHEELC